jgi:hypothetical protein
MWTTVGAVYDRPLEMGRLGWGEAIPRLSKAGWLCASKIPEMRTDGAVGKVAKHPYRFPRSAPYGIKEASRLFTNRPVCANKDAARPRVSQRYSNRMS